MTLFDLVKTFGEMLERAKNRPIYEVAATTSACRHDSAPGVSCCGAPGPASRCSILPTVRAAAQHARDDLHVPGGSGAGEAQAVHAGANGACSAKSSLKKQSGASTRRSLDDQADRRSKRNTSKRMEDTGHPSAEDFADRPDDREPAPPTATRVASIQAVLEAIVYVTDEPLTAPQIADRARAAAPNGRAAARQSWSRNTTSPTRAHRPRDRRRLQDGHQAEHHEAVRAFVKNLKPPLKLSLAALETLAVIAYKQPITRRRSWRFAACRARAC